MPTRTPTETVIAYYKAWDEGDTLTMQRLNSKGRNAFNVYRMWQQAGSRDPYLHRIERIEEDYFDPDSNLVDVYYDDHEIDRLTGEVVEIDSNALVRMIKLNGIWRMSSGPGDPSMEEIRRKDGARYPDSIVYYIP